MIAGIWLLGILCACPKWVFYPDDYDAVRALATTLFVPFSVVGSDYLPRY